MLLVMGSIFMLLTSAASLAEEQVVEGVLMEEIDGSSGYLFIGGDSYRTTSTVLVILEDGSYGSLNDVRAGAAVRAWVSDMTGSITRLQVYNYN